MSSSIFGQIVYRFQPNFTCGILEVITKKITKVLIISKCGKLIYFLINLFTNFWQHYRNQDLLRFPGIFFS